MKKKIFAMLIAVATVGGAIPAGATTITNRAQLVAITFDLAGDVLHVAPRRRPVGRLTVAHPSPSLADRCRRVL